MFAMFVVVAKDFGKLLHSIGNFGKLLQVM